MSRATQFQSIGCLSSLPSRSDTVSVFLTHPPAVSVSECVRSRQINKVAVRHLLLRVRRLRDIHSKRRATERSILTRRRNKFTLWPTESTQREKKNYEARERESLQVFFLSFLSLLSILYFIRFLLSTTIIGSRRKNTNRQDLQHKTLLSVVSFVALCSINAIRSYRTS